MALKFNANVEKVIKLKLVLVANPYICRSYKGTTGKSGFF